MSTQECWNCNSIVPAVNFCNQCGKPLTKSVWKSVDNQFARRVDVDDLEGFFKKELIVEAGTKALLFEKGKNIGELEEGTYTLDSFLRKFVHLGRSRKISAVITQKGNVPLDFIIKDCFTKEFLSVEVNVGVDFKVEDSALFVKNLMGDAKVYSNLELKNVCFNSISLGLKRELSKYSIEELYKNYDLIELFQKGIEASLFITLEGFGLKFMHIKAFDFKHESYDKMNKQKGECFLLIKKEQAELEKKKMLEDVYSQEDLLEIQEIKRKNQRVNMLRSLELEEEVLELNSEFERFNNIDKKKSELVNAKFVNNEMAKIELEKFAVEMEKEKLLREHDLKIMKSDLVEKDFNSERTRKHMLQLLEISQKEEIDKAGFEANKRMELRKYEHDYEIACRVRSEDNDKRLEKIKRDREDADIELENIRRARNNMVEANEFKRLQNSLDHKAEREIRLENHDDERDRILKDHELGRKIFNDKQEDEFASKKREYKFNQEIAEQNLDVTRKLNEMNRSEASFVHEQEMEKKKIESSLKVQEIDAEARHEQEKIAAMSSLRPEALIALAPAEQAKILARLERTKQLQGMSAEQILAMSAEKNPAVAEAFKALQANVVGERERELFERMLLQKDEANNREVQAHLNANKRIQDITGDAMNKIADVANTMAQSMKDSRLNTPVIVAGGVPVGGAGGTANISSVDYQQKKTIMRCPNCKADNDQSARCCSNCGQQL